MNDDAKLLIVGFGVGAAVLIGVYIAGKKAADTAKDALNAVNPFNHDNVFATGVNKIGATITGDTNFTLGGAIYDWTHPAFDPNAKAAPVIPPEKVAPIEDPNTGFNF